MALAGMVVAIGVRAEALSTLDAQCDYTHGAPCASSLEPVWNRGNTASIAATVLAVAGGVITGAGVLMLVLGVTQKSHERVSLVASPFGVGLVGSF